MLIHFVQKFKVTKLFMYREIMAYEVNTCITGLTVKINFKALLKKQVKKKVRPTLPEFKQKLQKSYYGYFLSTKI